jgi:hypothetical protein
MLLATDILCALPEPGDPPSPLPGTTWAERALGLFTIALHQDFGTGGIRVRVLWTSQAAYQSGMCAGTLSFNATGDEHDDDDAILNIAVYDKHHIDEHGVITHHAIRMLTPVTF